MKREKECPLCSGGNNCQIDNTTENCWCTMYTFTDGMNKLLETLPLQCICQSCVEKLGAKKKQL